VGSAEGLVRRMVMLTTFILDDDNNILLSDRVGGVGCCVVERAGKVGWFRREQGRARRAHVSVQLSRICRIVGACPRTVDSL